MCSLRNATNDKSLAVSEEWGFGRVRLCQDGRQCPAPAHGRHAMPSADVPRFSAHLQIRSQALLTRV